MTAQEVIVQAKNETEKRYKELDEQYRKTRSAYVEGMMDALDHIDSFLDSLQAEEPDALVGKDCSLPTQSTKGWAARDKRGNLNFFLGEPHKVKDSRGEEYWVGHARMKQPNNFLPELSWDDEPIEVELQIKRL